MGDTMKVDLPDGEWAEVTLPKVLRKRDVMDVLDAAEAAGVDISGKLGARTLSTIQDVLLTMYVTQWSLVDGAGGPVAVTLDSLGDLPMGTWQALANAVAPALGEIVGTETKPDPLSAAGSSSTAPTD